MWRQLFPLISRDVRNYTISFARVQKTQLCLNIFEMDLFSSNIIFSVNDGKEDL
jgi:hypothetical protein